MVASFSLAALKGLETEQFLQEMSAEMEKVSALYLKHERKMCRFYCALEDKVDAFASRIEVRFSFVVAWLTGRLPSFPSCNSAVASHVAAL